LESQHAGAANSIAPARAEQLAAAVVFGYAGTRAESAASILGRGAMNAIVRVTTAARAFIVRMRDEGDALMEYRKERWCLDRARVTGILGPTVLQIGTTDGIPYMIESHIDGTPGDELRDSVDLWRQLGRYAKRIHAIPVSGFGRDLSEPVNGAIFNDAHAPDWPAFIRYNIESLTADDPLIGLEVYPADRRSVVRERFERLSERALPIGLCHGDLKADNTIVLDSGEVALLDWGSACAHVVPHYDMRELVAGEPRDAFVEGYGLTPAEFSLMRAEVETFALLAAFDLVRWSIDRRPDLTAEYAVRARAAFITSALKL